MSTELRTRFTDFLATQRYAEKTISAYIIAVYGLASYSSQESLGLLQFQHFLL
ncbi:hypothetical protein KAR91_06290 [Candidatus Pacearchaeota archaeon]|nr:hypothetical protein [Candidatus Pacearchaeota archaeon]